ncbi:MAG: hydroxyacid dehydrogenase [Chloroflexi bacterium]|nr:hydroxyacid dehydrogenase [Chloroflexota bacterium]MCY3583280.1 hydroxyacid dehydrogenase [Chloroflexota bacterium]MCY3716466.1 hydroxyacid dehydrogenase [Chloroflexota bacterium]MDE2651708.1 hydroxyacid dehydrogenase [Chloroflexota bacterium]MYA93658.1 hydroxyacid dehydrogenase [Chloroflexota bacterium]
MKSKVIVDPHFRRMGEIFSPADKQRLADLVDVVWGHDEPMPQADFLRALPSVEAVICTGWRYGDVLGSAPNLRAILDVSGSFPLTLDYDACYTRRIRVLSAAPAFARQVAEFSLGLAIASARDIALGDRLMRRGDEKYLWQGNHGTFMLYDKPVGIIGYGSLARALQPLLQPFNVTIAAYDPWLSDGYLRRQGVTPMPLADLLASSRFIFVMAAPTKENQAMISRELLELIPRNAVFVLASRAHVVDFDALTEMALAGRFKVATDVFPIEPLPADHAIRQADGALLSAHRAGSVAEALTEMGEMVIDDLEAIVRGLPPRRLQMAEPELSKRYASNKAKSPIL